MIARTIDRVDRIILGVGSYRKTIMMSTSLHSTS